MQAGFNGGDLNGWHHQAFDEVAIFTVIIRLVLLLVPDAQRQIAAGNQCAALQLGVLLPVSGISRPV